MVGNELFECGNRGEIGCFCVACGNFPLLAAGAYTDPFLVLRSELPVIRFPLFLESCERCEGFMESALVGGLVAEEDREVSGKLAGSRFG